jgi:hypothetical protein
LRAHRTNAIFVFLGGEKTKNNFSDILIKSQGQLLGQATGIGPVNNWNVAGLDVAISGQKSEDLMAQARDLVGKITSHPEVPKKMPKIFTTLPRLQKFI